jgi:hypothetical protein
VASLYALVIHSKLKSMASIPSPRATRTVTAANAKQRMLKQLVCSDAPEQALRYYGFERIAGVDEVGRGALFGPVVAAAVILPERLDELANAGLKDSKQMTREERESLDQQIRAMALAVCVAEVDAETIDRVNIYQATRMAMLAAVHGLTLAPDHRCDAAGSSLPTDEADLRRCVESFDCSGFGDRKGASGRVDERAGSIAPGVWTGVA